MRILVNIEGGGSTNIEGYYDVEDCIDLIASETDHCWEFSHWSGDNIEDTYDPEIEICTEKTGFDTTDYGSGIFDYHFSSPIAIFFTMKNSIEVEYIEGGLPDRASWVMVYEVQSGGYREPIEEKAKVYFGAGSAGGFKRKSYVTPFVLEEGKYYILGIQLAIDVCDTTGGGINLSQVWGFSGNSSNSDIEVIDAFKFLPFNHSLGEYAGFDSYYYGPCPDGSAGVMIGGTLENASIVPSMGLGGGQPQFTYTAHFVKKKVSIEIFPIHDDHCSGDSFSGISFGSIDNNIECGDEVCLSVSTNERWRFVGWSVFNSDTGYMVESSTKEEFCFNIYDNLTAYANFVPRVKLTVKGRGNDDVPESYYGSIDIGFGEHWYDCGSYVYFCPYGIDPYVFSHFEGSSAEGYKHDVDGERCKPLGRDVPHYGILMDGDKEFTCVFLDREIYNLPVEPFADIESNVVQGLYTINYLSGSGGSIEGDLIQSVVVGGINPSGFYTRPVKAVPDQYYEFDRWSDGHTLPERREKTVNGNLSFTAYFKPVQYRLEYLAGDNGSVVGDLIQYVDRGGSGSEVTAVPDDDHSFIRWSDGVLSATRQEVNVTQRMSFRALFRFDGFYVRYYSNEGGSIEGDLEQKILQGEDGTEVVAVPIDHPNASFVQWSDGSTDPVRKEEDVQSNMDIFAVFHVGYIVTYIAGEGGNITGDLDQYVDLGESATPVTAKANSGYKFDGWSDGITSHSRRDAIINDDLEITALFSEV